MMWKCEAKGAGARGTAGPLRRRYGRGLAAGLLSLSLGACDFPTEPPIFETRLVFPGEATTLRVAELLPASVTVSGSDFTFAIDPVTFSRSLAQLCGAPCVAAHGLTIPKPPFADTFPVSVTLPPDVQSAVLTGGAVNVTIANSFGFDPLRPANGPNGSLSLTVRSGGTVLGSTTVTDPFPSGTPLTRTVALNAGATVTSPLTIDIGLISPAGTNPVTVNANAALSVSAAPAGVRVSQASVRVPATAVDVEDVEIDLADVSQDVIDRVQSGAVIVRMTNPFAVGGDLALTVSGANVAPKTVRVEPCPAATPCVTSQRVVFSRDEMRSLLGSVVTFRISGTVSSASGFVTVRPTQQIDIETQLDLVLRLGGEA